MALEVKDFIALTMATLKADGKRKYSEYKAIKDYAQKLNMDSREVQQCIGNELSEPSDISDVISSIHDEADRLSALKACIAVAIADNLFAQKEIDLSLPICKALGFDEDTLMNLTDHIFAKEEKSED